MLVQNSVRNQKGIVDNILPKNQFIAKTKWHYQIFESTKSYKKSNKLL